jgi:peptidoglycan hydrolase-like protein with peptidoglycan-binding domain
LYGTAIYPLGQLYDDPPPSQIVRFRQLAGAYGARGLSWFDWQNASTRGFDATGSALPALTGFTPQGALPTVGRGARGDFVVWAQQHLITAGQSVTADGGYGAQTETAVRNFQASKGLPVSGSIDASTWQALLRYAPTVRAFARTSRAGRARSVTGPPSAALPAVANELRGGAPE